MASLLIAVIYLAFVSLGLPDSLLGSAWPVMHLDVGAPLAWAGLVSMLISAFTILSALLSDRVTKRLGTGPVTAISVFLTAGGMLAFSMATSFWQLCLFAVPYGLGAGAIDACLNNYVALHLSSRHMNWLHCFWGVGATVSPYIMGLSLTGSAGWHGGYRLVAAVQFVLGLAMVAAIPLWHRESGGEGGEKDAVSLSLPQIFRLPGAGLLFFSFLFYCAIEQLPIVWASTYFAEVFAVSGEKAAFFASLFYIGLTASRGVCGFFANRAGDRRLIRWGIVTVLAAALLILLPLRSYVPALIGFLLIGIGCGPVYPSFIHQVPENFGKRYSGSVIGVQMGFAYLGTTFTPILFGKLAEAATIRLLPVCAVVLSVIVLTLTELLHRAVARRR